MVSKHSGSGQSPDEVGEHMQDVLEGEGNRGIQQKRTASAPLRVNPKVREYFDQPSHSGQNDWLSRHEIPSSAEVLDNDGDDLQSSTPVELNANNVDGPWISKENYLSTFYELLREDALQPLREAVAQVRESPEGNEDAFESSDVRIGIYGNVHVCGITASNRGLAVKVTFGLARIGKRIPWKQSKRLITGSMVVLSPRSDSFRDKAIVAIVAARPLEALELDPPEIDLFFARTEELEIDPAVEYVMIEERSSFYESQRHTLRALQKMMLEPFPLAEHLVGVQTDIPVPPYVQQDPEMDLSVILDADGQRMSKTVNVINNWPIDLQGCLDESQYQATRRILTKQLAIIQGPPGTGKTFISVQAIKIMLASQAPEAPPIIVACQTNHAVDQLLRHIADFETDFVRLGGMSKDTAVIKPRTLFEVRRTEGPNLPASFNTSIRAVKGMRAMERDFERVLRHLRPTRKTLDYRGLERLNIISKVQADSLESGALKWASKSRGDETDPFVLWLGDKLVKVPPRQQQENLLFEYEETEIAYEYLREQDAENSGGDEESFKDILKGNYYDIADNFTCRKPPGGQLNVLETLKEQDLWKVPPGRRGVLYRYFQAELKTRVRDDIRNLATQYNNLAKHRQIGLWEQDETILKTQKIIGMTTTGLSKYRGLLSALEPRIVLIEEAAETLEPPVAVACMPSVQHLILVGDHQQLRPHTKLLKCFKLDISLFERLIMNNLEYSRLNKQRRMIPEVRRLLYPIYGNGIEDHPFVTDPANRPNVMGMGGINSYFFTHQWDDQRDELMSAVNLREADMVARFSWYLFDNGASLQNITILTFYNGQRKRINQSLRDTAVNGNLAGMIRVTTVDSYQGEENDIVILSLVRSNKRGDVGFLSIDNRVCVALSRAKCGFYIFGNADALYASKSKTWMTVINILLGSEGSAGRCTEPEVRLSRELPICCQNHHNRLGISSYEDWEGIHGGCREKCPDVKPCGHSCGANCHPWPHGDSCDECGREKGAEPPLNQHEAAARLCDRIITHPTPPKSYQNMPFHEFVINGLDTDSAAYSEEALDETHTTVYHNLDAVDLLPIFEQMPALRVQLNELVSLYARSTSRDWQCAVTAWFEKFKAVSWRMNHSENKKLDYSQFKSIEDIPEHDREYQPPRPIDNGLLVDIQPKMGLGTSIGDQSAGDIAAKDWSQEQSLLD